MSKTIEALARKDGKLDDRQRQMVQAAADLFKVDAVAARLREFDLDHYQELKTRD